MHDPIEIAQIIAREVQHAVNDLKDTMFVRGTVTAVATDGTCSVKIEGSATALAGIPSIGSYVPVINDIVIIMSMGRTGANLLIVGGAQGGLNTIVRNEVPTGSINGTNTVFTTASDYVTGSLAVYRNGIRLKGGGDDYTDTGGGFTMVTAPATGARILVDYAVATSEVLAGVNSIVVGDSVTGTQNGTNKIFTVNGSKYAAGSLEVMVNGLAQKRVTHFTESDPETGEFTFDEAPLTNDVITVNYHKVFAGSGNADTVDGYHASEFILANATQTMTNKTFTPEDWHIIGDAGEPSFQNGWVNYSATENYAHAGFYKDSEGMVHLKGLIKDGTANSVMFNLPVGYRPLFRHIFPTASNNAFGRVDVQNNGNVSMHVGSTSWQTLSGIRFRAEQ